MKINPKNVSVSVYRLDGQTKAVIQMTLPDIAIERDSNGIIKEEAKSALQIAMRHALSQWELDVQDSD